MKKKYPKRQMKKDAKRELLKLLVTNEGALGAKHKQQIELLSPNKEFEQAILRLRKEFRSTRSDHQKSISALVRLLGTDVIMMSSADQEDYLSRLYDRKETPTISTQQSKELAAAAVQIAKSFKLHPTQEWSWIIEELALANDFDIPRVLIRANPWFKKASKYGFGVLSNCYPTLTINPATKEKEILLRIYADTSLGDVKESWNYVKRLQATLKKEHRIKQWYPLKNIKVAQKLMELDKTNLSDGEKQEMLFGEHGGTDFGEVEKKRSNRMRQIRYKTRSADLGLNQITHLLEPPR